MQSIAELRTHSEDNLGTPDDLAAALQFYGARIGRDLGRLHELTESKIGVGFIVEVATIYEHLLNKDPEGVQRTPYEIFSEDLIPFMATCQDVVKEEHPDGIDVTETIGKIES